MNRIKNKNGSTLPFYLFSIGFFLIIISPKLLSHGTFMDGVMYAAIANNLSNGIGTFWDLHFSQTYYWNFYEHPPLAMGIQSLFFSVFGESRFVEKIYSLSTFIVVGYVIVKIWHTLRYKNAWIPLLFWFLIPLVWWSSTNNMLENTMTIFTCLSVLFYLKKTEKKYSIFIILSGCMLSLAFLTKGFVAFFPWVLPFLMWILLKNTSFLRMVAMTLVFVLSTLLPLLVLVVIVPESLTMLTNYFEIQVLNSIKNVVTVESRFYILYRLFSELIPVFLLCSIFISWVALKKYTLEFKKNDRKIGILFLLLGMSGVLPVMITMKQSGFYILATFPFFAIGIGVLLQPFITALVNRINYASKGFLLFKFVAYVCFSLGIALPFCFIDDFNREKEMMQDVYTILPELPKGTIITIDPAMSQDYSLHACFSRYKNISLDPNLQNERTYVLLNKNSVLTKSDHYTRVNLSTKEYHLFKRKKPV